MTVYEPEDTIAGSIYVRCSNVSSSEEEGVASFREMMSQWHLEIEVSGREKVYWQEEVLVPKDATKH